MSIEPLVNMYLTTEVGHRIEDIGREKGREQGLEQGLEQGREQGREDVLLALLRTRFGDGSELGAVAHQLAQGNDEATVIEAILAASSPGSLLGPVPPLT